MARHRVIGVSFDHMHMGDLLRQVAEHPDAEIVAVFDPDRQRMQAAVAAFGIPDGLVYTDLDACLAGTPADIAIVCSTTAEHAGTVERLAPHGLDVMVEKPFAANAHEARRMVAALDRAGGRLAINWPLAWSPALNTAKRLVEEGAVGALIELHYYGGNRGPLFHLADKVEVSPKEVEAQKPTSWWYRKESGGGSLLDYLGYGATLGTWLLDGEAPIEVTAVVDETPGIEVDQHSVTVCRYRRGLSIFETRWGMLSDPWTQQPQPRTGFVLVGSEGSLSCYDYEPFVTLQTRTAPQPARIEAAPLPAGRRNAIEYLLSRRDAGAPIDGPLDPAISLVGQRIIDSALQSAAAKRTVPLAP
jgi:predicted dehydrogenase